MIFPSYFRVLAMTLIACPAALSAESSKITLTADTSRPEMSTFTPGEPIELIFQVKGVDPDTGQLRLLVDITDEHDQSIRKEEWTVETNQEGQWTERFLAPNQRRGFYRVHARLSNGVTLAKLGSRAAGYLTYCIVPDPTQRPLFKASETRFGMQGGFNSHVNVLPYLGVRWVLGGLAWGKMETNRAGEFKETVDAAKQQEKVYPLEDWDWPYLTIDGQKKPWKVYQLPTLYSGPPKWATLDATRAATTAALTPESEKAWGEYCKEAAESFSEAHPDMEEHVYQITWEPMYPWGFKGADEQLIRIYEIAYPALHKADSKALVIGPTASGMDLQWHASLFKKGLGKYLDGMSIHPYKAVPPEVKGLLEDARGIKEIIHQYTGKDLPMFGTEQGTPTGEDPNLELNQARGMIRANLILLGEGYRMNIAFYSTDYPGEPGFGYYYCLNPEVHFGADKVGPKPIAPAYAAQSFLLEGHSSAGPIEWLGNTALGYVFEKGDDVILALWDYGDHSREVSLPVGVKKVDCYDWMGNQQPMATTDGGLKVTLTPEPIYIRGISTQLWGSLAKKTLELSTSRLTSYPGGKAIISGKVEASSNHPLSGTLLVEPDEKLRIQPSTQSISLKPGQQQSFQFPLAFPLDVPLSAYPIKVTLKDEKGALGSSGIMLNMGAPVQIQTTPIFDDHGHPAMKIDLFETQEVSLQGTVQTSLRGISGSSLALPFKLGPHGRQSLVAAFESQDLHPARIYQAVVAVTILNGARFEQEMPVNFWQAAHFSAPPVIDGDISEWKDIAPVEIKGLEWVLRSLKFYHGTEATLRYGWDKHALYLACDVHDDVFCQPYTGFMTWKADSVQLKFNLDPGQTEQTGNLLADTAGRRCSEITLALTSEGPQAFRTSTFDAARFPVDLIPADKLKLAVVRKDNHTVYEAAIPWETLGSPPAPKAGDRIGISVTVNDADDPKQLDPSALVVFDGIYPDKDPKKMGSLLLGPVDHVKP